MEIVKKRQRGQTTVSSKHQVTIPVSALRAAGLKPGDRLRVTAEGPGRLVLESEQDIIARLAGSMPGVWEPGWLDRLRDEWDR